MPRKGYQKPEPKKRVKKGDEEVVHRAPRNLRGSQARYVQLYDARCFKCGTRWRLTWLLFRNGRVWKRTKAHELPVSELMLVCEECKWDIYDRADEQLAEDEGPFGGYVYGAAWNCPRHRYPEGHPARESMPQGGWRQPWR
jgi:hypothetical protein